MLNQKLQQKLLQKLSPQQILLMKLLQIPSIGLEQRIKQEIEENPALEEIGDGEELQEISQEWEEPDRDENSSDENEEEPKTDANDEFDLEDYLNDEDEIPAYRLHASNTSPDDERKEVPIVSGISFQDYLISQLGLNGLNDRQLLICEHIIGNLDESGYLNRDLNAMVDDLAFTQNIQTDVRELESHLLIIQDLDPPGVGARNLRECLLIQLRRSETPGRSTKLAIHILERYFNEFTKKHYDKIIRKAKITERELKAAVAEILKLNPKPGDSVPETVRTSQYIIPDFFIYNNNGTLELTLSSRNMPELRLNRTYVNMMEGYSGQKNKGPHRDAATFVRQKVESARWFIEAIRQRQVTLYTTMEAIMNYQREYFLTGDETRLKPMILKDIAEIVNLDISTISRVANSKYVQTAFGTFLLKTFFSESLQTTSGEEVSTREIKKILSDFVEAEDKSKPLTDEELTGILKEKGYNIARRTIAKYREQLGIPVARLRKQL